MAVDLKACRAALVRLADEDMTLDMAIDELAELRPEVERLRAIEAAARVVVADDHRLRSVHSHWEALYAALGVPRGTFAARWAAMQEGWR